MAGALAQDPNYLAYLRALGFEQAETERRGAADLAQVEQRAAFERPEIGYQAGVERRGMSGGYEDRGLFGSSMHELALADQRRGEQLALGRIDLGAAEQAATIANTMAAELARSNRMAAEQALATGGRLYEELGTDPYRSY